MLYIVLIKRVTLHILQLLSNIRGVPNIRPEHYFYKFNTEYIINFTHFPHLGNIRVCQFIRRGFQICHFFMNILIKLTLCVSWKESTNWFVLILYTWWHETHALWISITLACFWSSDFWFSNRDVSWSLISKYRFP